MKLTKNINCINYYYSDFYNNIFNTQANYNCIRNRDINAMHNLLEKKQLIQMKMMNRMIMIKKVILQSLDR